MRFLGNGKFHTATSKEEKSERAHALLPGAVVIAWGFGFLSFKRGAWASRGVSF